MVSGGRKCLAVWIRLLQTTKALTRVTAITYLETTGITTLQKGAKSSCPSCGRQSCGKDSFTVTGRWVVKLIMQILIGFPTLVIMKFLRVIRTPQSTQIVIQ